MLAVFAAYSLSQEVLPLLSFALLFAVLRAAALGHPARAAVQRAQFDCTATCASASTARKMQIFAVLLIAALLVPVTLGIAYPWYLAMKRRLFVENSSYGSERFAFSATTRRLLRRRAEGFASPSSAFSPAASSPSASACCRSTCCCAPMRRSRFARLSWRNTTLPLRASASTAAGPRAACSGLYFVNALGVIAVARPARALGGDPHRALQARAHHAAVGARARQGFLAAARRTSARSATRPASCSASTSACELSAPVNTVGALYFDGKSSDGREVMLELDAQQCCACAAAASTSPGRSPQVRASERIGSSRRHLYFPDGSQCETGDNDARGPPCSRAQAARARAPAAALGERAALRARRACDHHRCSPPRPRLLGHAGARQAGGVRAARADRAADRPRRARRPRSRRLQAERAAAGAPGGAAQAARAHGRGHRRRGRRPARAAPRRPRRRQRARAARGPHRRHRRAGGARRRTIARSRRCSRTSSATCAGATSCATCCRIRSRRC